jgi:DNA-binding transcriptional regulator YdaS (Cro superfamily)
VRQSAIAQLLGVSEAYISLLVSGKKQPSLKTACTIEAITSGKVKASDWLIQI